MDFIEKARQKAFKVSSESEISIIVENALSHIQFTMQNVNSNVKKGYACNSFEQIIIADTSKERRDSPLNELALRLTKELRETLTWMSEKDARQSSKMAPGTIGDNSDQTSLCNVSECEWSLEGDIPTEITMIKSEEMFLEDDNNSDCRDSSEDEGSKLNRKFECKICKKSCTTKQRLQNHERIHSANIEERLPYKCDICDGRFSSKKHRNTHLPNDDPLKRKFKCETCDNLLASRAGLRKHSLSHLDENDPEQAMKKRQFKCDKCDKRFIRNSHLKFHMTTHLNNNDPVRRPYPCDMCTKRFTQLIVLQMHKRKIHLPADHPIRKKFECEICHKFFSEKGDFKNHKLAHLNNFVRKLPYKCDICEKQFASKSILQVHKNTHLAPDDPNKRPFTCEVCGKAISSAANLQIHMRVHMAADDPRKNRFECDICHKGFPQRANLDNHQRVHMSADDPRKKAFQCGTCHKYFVDKNDLRKHERIHLEDVEKRKPYSCDDCGKRFSTSSYLLAHKNVHLAVDDPNRKLWKCEVDGCGIQFSYANGLRMHRKTHLQDIEKRRPFKCDVCDKRFVRSSHLQKHKTTHLDPGPFECEICMKVFSRKERLTVHNRKSHKICNEETVNDDNPEYARKEVDKDKSLNRKFDHETWSDDEESENDSEDE